MSRPSWSPVPDPSLSPPDPAPKGHPAYWPQLQARLALLWAACDSQSCSDSRRSRFSARSVLLGCAPWAVLLQHPDDHSFPLKHPWPHAFSSLLSFQN